MRAKGCSRVSQQVLSLTLDVEPLSQQLAVKRGIEADRRTIGCCFSLNPQDLTQRCLEQGNALFIVQ